MRRAKTFWVWAALVFVACLPAPGTPGDGATGGVASQTGVPLADANGGLGQGAAGASTRQPFSSAQGSLTISAASAPDLCLTVTQASATTGDLVLRSCDASWPQRFVLVNGQLQSADGNCVMFASGLSATAGNAVMAVCDPNNPNQQFVFNGGALTVGTPAANLALQSSVNPASTQSYISFTPLVPKSLQQQWTLAQSSHNDSKSLLISGTHLVPIETISSCLTAAGNALVYQDCAPVNPNQAFIGASDGTLRLGQQCVNVRLPAPMLTACNPNDANQLIGVKNGVLFSGLVLCVDRDPTQTNVSVTKACDLVNAPHFVVGLSQ